MSDLVNFKAYLVGNDTKSEASEVRRFSLEGSVSTSLEALKAKLLSGIFPELRRKNIQVSWLDQDNDNVIIGSDEELIICLTEQSGPLYKIYVKVKGDAEVKPEVNRGEMHEGVLCDGCDGSVIGFRYKCVVCPDYDLCSTCEAKGIHPGHNMIRISSPEVAWPGHFFRRLNKMHERINKRMNKEQENKAKNDQAHCQAHQKVIENLKVTIQNAKEQGADATYVMGLEQHLKDLEKQLEMMERHVGSNYDPNMDPFLNGGHWVHGMGGPRFGRGRGRGCRGMNGGRVWQSMMQGWRGDQEEKKQNDEVNKEAKTAEEVNDPFAEFVNQIGSSEYLKNVGKIVAEVLDPLGVNVEIDIEHGGQRTNIKEAKEAKEEEKESVEIPVVVSDKKEKVEVKEDKASSPEPSDDDDWTLIKNEESKGAIPKVVNIPVEVENKEEKTEIPVQVQEQKTEIPVQVQEQKTEIPVQVEDEDKPKSEGQDIPINVSDKPAKVLFGSPDGTLYPELPKKQDDKPSAPPAAAVAEHPDPRIQVALQAMLNMGFTNEGGWLSQLLEAKDGDIGKALDVLQPVRPVRN